MEINTIKSKIYEHVQKGTLSKEVLDALIPNTGVVPKETSLWDYKEMVETQSNEYVKTIKLIASFHNSYGGYIVYGVKETEQDKQYELCGLIESTLDVQKLKGQIAKYLSARIDVSYDEFSVSAGGKNFKVGLLHIPKRVYCQRTVSTIRTGSDSSGKPVFKENQTLYRYQDVCSSAGTQLDFDFLMGRRDIVDQVISGGSSRNQIIQHNLPDKNFICANFVGRQEIIQELWAWLSDEFQYTKVLAGEGGKGKTSIAYEFSKLLASAGSSMFDQILWLTAKEKQFRPDLDDFVNTPETHFNDLESLLKYLCQNTGALLDEIEDTSITELKRVAKSNLATLATFLVIDDIDSVEPDEQKRIMEAAYDISNGNSKVLLTTRSNISYSSDRSIEVPGLHGDDYVDLIDGLTNQLGLKELSHTKITRLEKASQGSPMFSESILRLVKLGYDLNSAVGEWTGQKGEAVRNATLSKEIERLSPEAKKILLASAYFSSFSFSELAYATELEPTIVESALEELGNLFLLQAVSIIEEERRFEISKTVAILVKAQSKNLIPNAEKFISSISQLSKAYRTDHKSRNNPEVGAAIRQSVALLRTENYKSARETVSTMLKRKVYSDNPDLLLMSAKIELEDPAGDTNRARNLFDQSYRKGQRKELLFDLWYEVERLSGTREHEVIEYAISQGFSTYKWFLRGAESNKKMGQKSQNVTRAIQFFTKAHRYVSQAINYSKGKSRDHLIDLSKSIVDAIWEVTIENDEYLAAYSAMESAILAGDVRRQNYYRLGTALSKLKNLTTASRSERIQKEANENFDKCYSSYEKLIRKLPENREDLIKSMNEKAAELQHD